MRRTVLSALATALLLAAALPAFAAGVDTAGLLRELADSSAHVRERAAGRLLRAAELDDDAIVTALADASPRTRAALLEVIGQREIVAAGPDVARIAAGTDPVAAEAAIRTLVLLGDDAVAAGLVALPGDRPELAVRRSRLRSLAAQDAIERDLLSRWRRKGGSYDGRFAILEKHGWPVQPLLFAMLLDVPLEDRFLASPEDGELSEMRKFVVLFEIRRSERRGYRTFRRLPTHIDDEDLFDLSAQALRDVVDIDVLGDPLQALARDLDLAHRRFQRRIGFQLRQFERYESDAIAEVLARHGRKELLERRAAELAAEAQQSLMRAQQDHFPPDRRAEALQWYATDLSQLAGVLHQMRDFDRAAEVYAESIRVSTDLGGSPPGIASYNRACALARGGHADEALRQLDTALQSDSTDLSREWVEEDGDLHTLRSDPRFKVILDRAFGE